MINPKNKLNKNTQVYDAIVIGAGISGLVFLKYAKDKNLKCLVLEKQEEAGGLWKNLPTWQDIQNKIKDFTINDVPLEGAKQPQIYQFIKTWIRKYKLEPYIQLKTEVTSVSRESKKWHIQTSREKYQSENLIIASGIQNEIFVPGVDRKDPEVIEKHSSDLYNPEILKDKVVTVVGGGTSSWDLLEQAIKQEAKDIHWVYRSIKWSLPTKTSKQGAWPNLREMAFVQSVIRSINGVNIFLRGLLGITFRILGSDKIKPGIQFDQRKHQLIPGRSLMVKNLNKIKRHPDEIKRIEGKKLYLKKSRFIKTDILLWATGYRMNLSYLGLSKYEKLKNVNDLFPKLGSLMISRDYPNMFFVGMPLLGSTSATPFFSAIESKTIVAHILGKCHIPDEPILHHINHWDLFRYFARFDRSNYPPFRWKFKYFFLAVYYMLFQHKSVRI